MTNTGWFEEYRCGCVSGTARVKRDLLGYCRHHGEDRRGVFRTGKNVAVQHERSTPAARAAKEAK